MKTLTAATLTSAKRLAAEAAERALILSEHAIMRRVGRESHVSVKAVRQAIDRGETFYDPKNNSITSVLQRSMASGDDLLVGRNPETGLVTTVMTGTDLVRPRFVPLE